MARKRDQATAGGETVDIPLSPMNSTNEASEQSREGNSMINFLTRLVEDGNPTPSELRKYASILNTEKYHDPKEIVGDDGISPNEMRELGIPFRYAKRIHRLLGPTETIGTPPKNRGSTSNNHPDSDESFGSDKSLADPLQLIRDEENKLGRQDTILADSWSLAYPRLSTNTPNLEAIKGAFQELKTVIDANLRRTVQQNVGDEAKRDELAIGIQSGMGVGKSHIIDIVDKLYPDDQTPLVLKVTYNKDQDLSREQSSGRNQRQGFHARVIMAIERKVPINCYRLVEDTLAAADLTPAQVAKAVLTKANKAPIVICIDEIGHLTKNNQQLANYLHIVYTLQKAIKEKDNNASCVVLITALPNVDILSSSSRPLKWLKCPPLRPAEAKSFLQDYNEKLAESKRLSDYDLQQIQLYCLGHPRSLAVAARLLEGGVPTAQSISSRCKWSTALEGMEDHIIDHIKAAYLDPSVGRRYPISHDSTKILDEKALLMKNEDGCFQIPPTLLFHQDFKRLESLKKMFDLSRGQSAAKALENVQFYFDLFRRQVDLPVIPPGYPITNGARFSGVELFASFNPDLVESTKDIFKVVSKKTTLVLDSILRNTYYLPDATGHPLIEAMFTAKIRYTADHSEDQDDVLVLFQSKINNDLPEALTGMKKAAEMLVEGKRWKKATASGKPGILFVVYALDSNVEDSTSLSKHHGFPVLVVGRGDLNRYFTPTLAGAPEILKMCHQHLNKKVAEKK